MDLFELIAENAAYIILGLTMLIIILFVMIILLMVKQRNISIKYKRFMQGTVGKDMESVLIERFSDIENLKKEGKELHEEIRKINENMLITIQKVGIVKYDAFSEVGGKISFALALLDKNNNGLLLNSVHSSREGCYTYLKEIIKGESFLELSKEEREALNRAINSDNYME